MFPVKRKYRIPHTEAYPLKAGEISSALADVPQAKVLQIIFWRYVRMEDRRRSTWPLLGLRYRRLRACITTSNDSITRGELDARWEIEISPVPRTMRHLTNCLLRAEALPLLRIWLIEREKLHGRFGHDWIRVSMDKETEKLRYERP